MVTCPLCEHQQAAGAECEVCGRRLTGPGAESLPVAALPGLEPTRMEAVEVPAETVPDLEPTRLSPAPEAAAEDLGWVEQTRAEPAAAVAVETVPDLEHHRAEPIPEGPGLDPLAPVVCRYCRSTAMPGDKFCGRCGMRLMRFDPVHLAGSERGELVCRDCGAMGAGPRCRRCGARMVTPG
ncbi:MAG: hypothetical protein HZB56_00445 [Deltaproteobacteria bacterium]|nr:hypothetical protein [Deltaproteobacteria bacterium]